MSRTKKKKTKKKNPTAAEMGQRSATLTPAQRSANATKAAMARWSRSSNFRTWSRATLPAPEEE